MAMIVPAVILTVLGVVTPAGAQKGSKQLYQTCLVQSDHTERSIERGVCDATAEANGYVHGVLQPLRCNAADAANTEGCIIQLCSCIVGEICPPWVQYECRGVTGGSR